MATRKWIVGSVCLSAVAGASFAVPGCVPDAPTDCASNGVCTPVDASMAEEAPAPATDAASAPPDADADGADGANAADADGAADGQDGADGFDGFVCDPALSPHDDPCVLTLDAGIFVAASTAGGSDTTGDGSKAAPYATLGYALTHLTGESRVYVCTATFHEAVSITAAGVRVYGGLACPVGASGRSWSYLDGGQAQVIAPPNEIALTVNAPGSLDIEDMMFMVPSASGQDDAGNGLSSIAALVNDSTVTFRRCAFGAGNGASGNGGAVGSNYVADAAPSGQPPSDSGVGGAGAAIQCTDGTSSQGGTGGNGGIPVGANGGDGGAHPLPPFTAGQDGLGGGGGSFSCGSGAHPGANGTPGASGIAAAAGAYGALRAQGWTPTGGAAGTSGGPGQGGGGGGGLAAPLLGGTGGGAGGCGGAGGAGGAGGGASIGLACISANVTLESCVINTGAGGAGGPGGQGQPGQNGGVPGTPPVVGGCAGGYGGNGAGGAGGAGGTGGLSACIVFAGNAPVGSPICTPGDAGTPGLGGGGAVGGSNTASSGPAGADGGRGAAGTSEAIFASP
jgi:hypothetical protein